MPSPNGPVQPPSSRFRPSGTALAVVAYAALGLLLSSVPRSSAPATSLKEMPSDVAVTCEPPPIGYRDCHANFQTGCTDSVHPNYDAYLNDLKDRTGPFPGQDTPRMLGLSDFKTLESSTPQGLNSRNHETFKSELAKLGEGEPRGLIGYLYYTEVTGAETSNCKLTGEANVDYHIGMGFTPDPDLAKPASAGPTQAEQQGSVVVEMTPHTRAAHNAGNPAQWTSTALENIRGKQVKVVGQLMMDNEHNNVKDNCGLAGATANCWRLSAWELHPVMKFLVCKQAKGCDVHSPDTDWTDLGEATTGAAKAAPAPAAPVETH